MKGFPNQIAELAKLAKAMQVLVQLVESGANAKDYTVFGMELLRAGVIRTGHRPKPIEEYIKEQLKKKPSDQSFRTIARGLRELFRLLGFIDDSGPNIRVTPSGHRAASFADRQLGVEELEFWRRSIRNITKVDGNNSSHPYQVLLRLVAKKPGIKRAKCALALEAADDSPEELERIVALVNFPEDEIRERIAVTKSNWDNAKKVLPRFAEQLGDVIRVRGGYYLADAPGRANEGEADIAPPADRRSSVGGGSRAPRSSREVTAETIARAGTGDESDEVDIPPPDLDPATAAEARRRREDRLRRHNIIVRELAATLSAAGATLFEDPFDVLALIASNGILVEVKTLDGSEIDERERVRDALGQLLYYEGFVTTPILGGAPTRKVACFEAPISAEHAAWLNSHRVAVVWKEEGGFVGDALAGEFVPRGVLRRSL